jgi:cephalosporin hydroxylase
VRARQRQKIGVDSGSIGGPIHQHIADFQARFGQVDIIKGDSHHESAKYEVLSRLQGEPLDFLFLDGDHTLAGVTSDYQMYAPLVRGRGWIRFHDIT